MRSDHQVVHEVLAQHLSLADARDARRLGVPQVDAHVSVHAERRRVGGADEPLELLALPHHLRHVRSDAAHADRVAEFVVSSARAEPEVQQPAVPRLDGELVVGGAHAASDAPFEDSPDLRAVRVRNEHVDQRQPQRLLAWVARDLRDEVVPQLDLELAVDPDHRRVTTRW